MDVNGKVINEFNGFFQRAAGLPEPYSWQRTLGENPTCTNRLIRIPTGFGKTIGVLSAWMWNRIARNNDEWPRRLVWCLPMRVLVEQTEQEARTLLDRIGILWNEKGDHSGKVGVHLLMGGADSGDWHLYPEHFAVLIGTQDMLLSRALNRGYGAPRARWPMDFGLLNQDSLWIMDEVQLMDVGLATSGQLQAFQYGYVDNNQSMRPRFTWWMSATLQKDWLQKSPDTKEMIDETKPVSIFAHERKGHLWDDVIKPCQIENVKDDNELTKRVVALHTENAGSATGPTLVVVNRVERAVNIFEALRKEKLLKATDLRLVHSRFRPHERQSWRTEFLTREAWEQDTGRIIIATQVVEAGVDLSAGLLITELAPWPSMVQRFGRSARWGGTARIFVVDFNPTDDGKSAPYAKVDLDSSRDALQQLNNVSPLFLEQFEESNHQILTRLYPYNPTHLILQHELDELFDTSPDLSGSDIDISRFIRSGDERDVQVFWVDVPFNGVPESTIKPSREVLCSVPFLRSRDWLCGKKSGGTTPQKLKKDMRAWVWDWLDGNWRKAERQDLYPGQTVLVDSRCGGYITEKGWIPESTVRVETISLPSEVEKDDLADAVQDDESLSKYEWQTIAVHGRETARDAQKISELLVPDLMGLFHLAGRWHDMGKGFAAFNNSIKNIPGRPVRHDLAKAPQRAWVSNNQLYPMENGERRSGFRHELASTLALFTVLQLNQPDHEALLGPWREILKKIGSIPEFENSGNAQQNSIEREIVSLTTEDFNLLAYLICAHHGKIRVAWHSCPADQIANDEKPRIRGIRDGDTLPKIGLFAGDGSFVEMPEMILDLSPATAGLSPRTGSSWTERVLLLLQRYGPFTLAWLEALLRAADIRASKSDDVRDELLFPEVAE